MKMVQTRLTQTARGWKALAECPICGKMVYLGTTPHREEACIELPVQELVDICSISVHTEEQAVSHAKAAWAYEYDMISPEDYL
ncbi:MAG: hypothetical protein KAQ99_10195 [Candidatus Aureabacteria bacterium]|nr:hypothetical protein [Candidatus Auribacterota bacterium]